MSEIPYELVRSRRRTLALVIDGEARLVVRAPLRLGEGVIRDFVRRKARWVVEKQRQVRDMKGRRGAFVLNDGETVSYLGKSYTLFRRRVGDVTVDDPFMYVPDGMSLGGFAAWMRERCRGVVGERVAHYAGLMGLDYAAIRMSGARHRWGSCGAGNTLNFAWRLVMCPPAIIDYVVVHELSHIPHKGHGAKFWMHVARILPRYKEAQAWLRNNRSLLDEI